MLLEYINKATTPHHAVEVGAEFLLKKGLDLDKSDLTKKCLEYYKVV